MAENQRNQRNSLCYNIRVKERQKRFSFVRLTLVFVIMMIVGRLFQIQILDHEKYKKMAEEQQTLQNTIVAKRGEIYMMDGEQPVPVAMNRKVWTVIVDPMIADRKKTEQTIDKILGNNKTADWNEIFKDKKRRYFVVARNVARKEATAIKGAKLNGVWLQQNSKRVYPENELGARLLGFVNANGDGQYGVEGSLNKDLKGENGILKTVKDVNNIPLTIGDDNVRVPAKNGKNLVLSVDRNIQYAAEKALVNGVRRSRVGHASAVVMDPRTGQIWAMANYPSYNPAEYSKVKDAALFQNDIVSSPYEPASVCKTFTFAAAIDKGVLSPDTTYTNTGETVVDGWPIRNASQVHFGKINMQTAFSWSFNTGSTQALRLMGGNSDDINRQGKKILYDYYHDHFGLGEYTGIELVESKGIIIPPDNVDATNARYANMTFGQGLDLTMLQVLAAFTSVVNGGEYFTPTVIAGEMKDGKFQKKELEKPVRQTIDSKTSETMREMLAKARTIYGGTVDFDKGYYVGGKTGTAQVIKNGKYVMSDTIGSYVGFGSSSKNELPEYVIMVKIWEDGRAMDAGDDAKPIFDELSRYMNNYLKLRGDYEQSK